jgi:hypothetical protein
MDYVTHDLLQGGKLSEVEKRWEEGLTGLQRVYNGSANGSPTGPSSKPSNGSVFVKRTGKLVSNNIGPTAGTECSMLGLYSEGI